MRFLAKAELFAPPVVGDVVRAMGGIRVERGTELARHAVRVTEVALVSGGHVVAYPEGRVGLAAGMFYGFSFGLGGLGAAALGKLADLTSITTVYQLTPFLLLLGLLVAFLPRRPGAPSMGSA